MKKGFTLVELLAVIVILAIISIIAIPVVIDMINNSKIKSNKEGLNLYIDTVTKRIANSNLDILYNPDTCTIQSTGDLLCLKDDEELYVDEEKTNKILEIKMNGKKPSEGTLYFTDGKITTGENIKYNDLYYTITNGTVSKGSNEKTDIIIGVVARIKNSVGNISGTCEIQNTTTMVCGSVTKTLQQSGHKISEGIITFNNGNIISYANLKMDGKYYHLSTSGKKSESNKEKYGILVEKNGTEEFNKGDKYTYKVNATDTFNFYVLAEPEDGKVNLIMDRNICEDGSTVGTCNYGWHSTGYNTFGPTVAMTKLYNATKKWSNVPDMIMNYRDENNGTATDMGYTSIITINGVTTITGKPTTNITTIGTSDKPLKTRLPRYDEMTGAGCTGASGSCPTWLMENNGTYWLLSSQKNDNDKAFHTVSSGYLAAFCCSASGKAIRPVITVNISDLSN